MQLPFTIEQFYGVFREYNETLWPAQVFLTGLALAAITLVLVPRRWPGVAISAILAFLWAWLGVAYHLTFFAAINPLAYLFSGISMAGAAVFLWQGVIRRQLVFRWGGGARSALGVVLIVFALLVYPAWSWYAGHRYPAMPTFGLPCPTTIFTVGLLAFAVAPCPRTAFIVPILWCLVGARHRARCGTAGSGLQPGCCRGAWFEGHRPLRCTDQVECIGGLMPNPAIERTGRLHAVGGRPVSAAHGKRCTGEN